MRGPNDYQEFRQKVDMMLDNALSKEDEAQVLKSVEDNPEYEQLLRNERNFRSRTDRRTTGCRSAWLTGARARCFS